MKKTHRLVQTNPGKPALDDNVLFELYVYINTTFCCRPNLVTGNHGFQYICTSCIICFLYCLVCSCRYAIPVQWTVFLRFHSLLLTFFCFTFSLLISEAYDPLDPTGNITIKWDVISWTADGYVVSVIWFNYCFLPFMLPVIL